MKRVIYIVAALVAVSCSSKADYDAQGTFEATEVIISAEASGRILNFDIREGESIEANSVIGAIDSLQLHLQREQLKAQQSALLSSRPDKEKQVASLRSQIAKQRTELQRIENMLRDGATLCVVLLSDCGVMLPASPCRDDYSKVPTAVPLTALVVGVVGDYR